MELSTEINKEKNIRYHVVTGAIDVHELINVLQAIYDARDFDPEMNVFWDLQNADSSAVSSDDVYTLQKYVSNKWGQGGYSRAALVVSREVDFGMSRMYQIMMEGNNPSKIKVFKDFHEAEQWLAEES